MIIGRKNIKAQVTVFIVIGIVILGGMTIFLFFKDNTANQKPNIPFDVDPVYSLVQSCAEKMLIEGIDYVSKKGGYYDTPENAIDMEIAYYIYKGKNYMPMKEKVAESIAKYVNNDMIFCLNDFSDLQDFSVAVGEINSSVEIRDEKVLLKIKYPLSITKSNKTYVLEDFNSEFEVRLGVVYDVAKEIVDEQIKNKEGICIGCLYDLGKNKDVYIKTLDYGDDLIYTIIDQNSKINEGPFTFNFVNNYN